MNKVQKMENIEKLHPLLPKYNDTVVVVTGIQEILKASLISTSAVQMLAACQ